MKTFLLLSGAAGIQPEKKTLDNIFRTTLAFLSRYVASNLQFAQVVARYAVDAMEAKPPPSLDVLEQLSQLGVVLG